MKPKTGVKEDNTVSSVSVHNAIHMSLNENILKEF